MSLAWVVSTALLLASHEVGSTDDRVETVDRWERAPLAVEWGHCTVVAQASTLLCVYTPGESIRLWIDHPQASEARVWIDQVEVEAERYSLAEEPHGQGLRVMVPPDSLELVLEVPEAQEAPETEAVRVWGLALQPRSPETRPWTESDLLAVSEAWAHDDVAHIEQTTARAIDGLMAQGRIGEAIMLLCGSSFHLRRLRAFEAAGRMLDRGEDIGDGFAEGRSTLLVYRGLLRWSQGDLHEAAALLRDGARLARRIDNPGVIGDALPIYAEALAELGYYTEARYWARESLRNPSLLPCDRATIERTAGWINLVLRARDQPHDDPRPRLKQALASYREEPKCAHKQGGAQLSLALLAAQDGDRAQAHALLDSIDIAALSAEDRVRAADLRVRLELQAGADSATLQRAWDALMAAAQGVDDDDVRWRLAVRQGQRLVRERKPQAAIEAFERAERLLDRLIRAQAVMGVGRTATADRYLEGTLALVSLLVDQGRASEAFCVAREARARRRSATAGIDALPGPERVAVRDKLRRYREYKRRAELAEALVAQRPREQEAGLRHGAERSAQTAAELVDEIVETLMRTTVSPRCHELVGPGPQEVLLGLYPRDDDWLIFTQDERGTTVKTVTALTAAEYGEPSVLGARLLEPLSEVLARASRVRVLADRQAQQLDVHLLPWRGAPLLAQTPVTYGVELPRRATSSQATSSRALLIADPTRTLTGARVEVQEVADQLGQADWSVDVLATDAPGVTVEFDGYALLHYAAHTATQQERARVWAPYPAGEAGGLPHLQVGPMTRLEVYDILAMRPVPPVAFLAGCRTGLVELDAGTTSLALAFLLADGQQVVASRHNVDDSRGLDIARRFYQRFTGSRSSPPARYDAAQTLHEVQRALTQQGDGVVPYRVWVR
ncbi:MAG: CHAT domain-containing protein [Myxococcota bacterium]